MMRPWSISPTPGVVTRLGRGVIVGPAAPAPEHWAGADRVVIDDAVLRDPAAALDALHRHWSQRIPVVVELQCSADELRAPETEPTRPPYALSPRFEFARERLYFLARANNYDDRVGRMVWGPTVEAQRLGAATARGRRRATRRRHARVVRRRSARGRHRRCPTVTCSSIATTSSNASSTADRAVTTHAELAADQLAAVVHDTGAARVIAPAGSGKTRVLTERFRLLVDRGWSPGSITAVAYNVRAKDTMRARLADMPDARAAPRAHAARARQRRAAARRRQHRADRRVGDAPAHRGARAR